MPFRCKQSGKARRASCGGADRRESLGQFVGAGDRRPIDDQSITACLAHAFSRFPPVIGFVVQYAARDACRRAAPRPHET